MNAFTPHGALAIPTLPIAAIIPSPSNPRKRFDDAYLDELAESIKTHGLIQPITVRPLPLDNLFDYNRKHPNTEPGETPTYEIVVGECRWRAAQRAGLVDIPAFWRELDDKQVLEIQVIENLQRRDVHPLEEADGYRMLIDRHQYRVEDIALKIGKSRSYVFARLKLCALGDAGREMFYAGGIEASVALMIARLPETDQIKMLKQLRQSNEANGEPISFRDAKWRIRNGFTIDLANATFPIDDAKLLPAAGSCTDCPKRSGNAPEICPDIDTADVCTDTRCFEEKRLARREQLLDGYRAKSIPVHVDEDAKMIAPGGNWWSIDKDRWHRLDERLHDDPEQRTIAEILGDQAPVSVVVEVDGGRHAQLLELVETTALAEALTKAGWVANTPAEDDVVTGGNGHSVGTYQRQREENAKALAAENARRQALRDRIVAQLEGSDPLDYPSSHSIVAAILLAQIRQDCDRGEEIFIGLEHFGIVTPDEYDEAEEIEKLATVFSGWPLVKLLALMAWNAVIGEAHIFNAYDGVFPPTHSLDALSRAVGLTDVAEAPDPTDAAQASGALPDEKQADAHELWPFPTLKNETKQNPIETNEKPKGRSRAKAKAVA